MCVRKKKRYVCERLPASPRDRADALRISSLSSSLHFSVRGGVGRKGAWAGDVPRPRGDEDGDGYPGADRRLRVLPHGPQDADPVLPGGAGAGRGRHVPVATIARAAGPGRAVHAPAALLRARGRPRVRVRSSRGRVRLRTPSADGFARTLLSRPHRSPLPLFRSLPRVDAVGVGGERGRRGRGHARGTDGGCACQLNRACSVPPFPPR